MGRRIITYSLVGLTMLFCACVSPGGEKGNDNHLRSTWQLDEKTHQAIVHHCVETNFTDTPATFILTRKGEDILLQFNGQHHVWMAQADKSFFYARQVLKSSKSGRFCDFQMEISISFRLTGNNQSKIKGIWRAPTCDYCPQVEFIAYKIN
ncbi:MAG: hypothetical protein WCX31_14275 [Salinivirgaceae bacterium]|jgi:hypothetical protein